MKEENTNEKVQIEAARTDSRHFEPLYTRYYERILKFIYKRVEDLEDCRELTSNVFTSALLNIKTYKDVGLPFSSWLYRIAVNEVNTFYRKGSRRRIISISERALGNIAEESGNVEKEMLADLKRSLLHLTKDELILIELRFFEELPFAEVAQILELTESNAKIKTYRTLEKLRLIYTKVSA